MYDRTFERVAMSVIVLFSPITVLGHGPSLQLARADGGRPGTFNLDHKALHALPLTLARKIHLPPLFAPDLFRRLLLAPQTTDRMHGREGQGQARTDE